MKRSYLTLVLLAMWATGEVSYAQRAPVRRGGGGGVAAPAPSRAGGSVSRAPSPSSRSSGIGGGSVMRQPSPSRSSGPVSQPSFPRSGGGGSVLRQPSPIPRSGGSVVRPVPGSRAGTVIPRSGSVIPRTGGVIIRRPTYPHYSPGRVIPGGVYNRIGSGNIVYNGYGSRFGAVQNRLDYMRGNVRIGGWVNLQIGYYRTHYYPTYVSRASWYNSYYPTWRARYTPWNRLGFYGGFYWNLRPVADIGVYFYNPMIHWFYSPQYDDYYYNTWYNSGISAYPEMRNPFPYTGTYFPTEEFRDLNLGMSQASVSAQVNYRRAMIDFTLKLQQQVSLIIGYQATLSANDIVINHYQQINGDSGVVIEGFVTQNQQSYPFKGYLDLNSGVADIFVTGSDGQSPTQTEMDQLGYVNSRIQSAGGVVEGEDYTDYSSDNNGDIYDPNIQFQ